MPAITYAVYWRDRATADLLLQRGADPNSVKGDALRLDDPAMTQLLLRHGLRAEKSFDYQSEKLRAPNKMTFADVFRPGLQGIEQEQDSILLGALSHLDRGDLNVDWPEEAALRGDVEALRRMLKAGSDKKDVDRALFYAVEVDGEDLAEMLMDAGTTADAECLGLAAAGGEMRVRARLFQTGGLELNATDKKGQNALHYAARSGQRQSIKFLIDHGADPDVLATDGKSPLDIALRFTSPSHQQAAVVLRNAGGKAGEKPPSEFPF